MNRSFLYLCIRILIVPFIVGLFRPFVLGQNSTMLMPYYFDTGHYIFDLDYVQSRDPDMDLFSHIADGAIVYMGGRVLGYTLDDSWNRIVYGDYKTWTKTFGEPGIGSGQFIYPSGIVVDGLGNMYSTDTYNKRIVKLHYDSTNQEIDANSFSTIGEGLLNSPWDLDVDDRGNNNPSDDVIWVVDNGLGQVVPFNVNGTIFGNGPIEFLYNPSTNTYYYDLSGICGIAVRKSGTGVNSTSNRRLYLVDWKLKKLFLVEAEAVENGEGRIYKEKSFNSNVMLSGVESDYFGDVWAVDNANGKVYKYTWDFEYLDQISGLNRPTSVASVRRHHLNMALTEQWTNTTGNRTYSHGANIKNLAINSSVYISNFDFMLTNYCFLEAKVYQGNALKATLDNGTNVSPSGMTSLNWYPGNPISGNYTLHLKAKSYDDSTNVYREITQNFYFGLLPPTNVTTSGCTGCMPTISWTASTSPGIDHYELWWQELNGPQFSWQLLQTTARTYWSDSRVTIAGSKPEDTYCYKVRAVNIDGFKSVFSNTVCVNVIESPPWGKELAGKMIPEEYLLKNNYPNPFNPVTTIKYDLPEDSFVELLIFDLLGREVKSLIRENTDAGYKSITWDSTDNNGKPLSSGVYLYSITAKSLSSEKAYYNTKKLVLLK